jgi:hypothetical protein
VRRPSRWFGFPARPRPAIHTVEVAPPSHGDEGGWVFLTAGFVCLCVIYVFAFQLYGRPGGGNGAAPATGLLAFQVLFRDLPGPEQRVFRQMKEGMEEALRLRGASGEWPAVESLAAAEIPPFAPDVLDRSSLAWSHRRDGPVIVYFGVPTAGTDMASFLILIQEPEAKPGESAAAAGVDEEHQLLPDGRLLHVTYWKRRPAAPPSGLLGDPALQGWQQIRIAGPFPATETP